MKFRPCIDIHNGKVKQIVGSTLRDENDEAQENFVSARDAAFYSSMYQKDGLAGGHIIMLNPSSSPYFEATRQQALQALAAYPGGMQIGGGIRRENAKDYLDAGASHVIVTSYVFRDGQISWDHLEALEAEIGREHLVLDVSCRKREGAYYVVTDRWQKFTDLCLTPQALRDLGSHCSEFLIHAVDVEGKSGGIETELVKLLASASTIPVTYAGGVRGLEDLKLLRREGKNCLDVTVGSALDLFGGPLSYQKVLEFCRET